MLTATSELDRYREARDVFIEARAKADVAWLRWFRRTQAGIRTSGAAAQRLANRANHASAELYAAEGRLWALNVDPAEIDRQDGIVRVMH